MTERFSVLSSDGKTQLAAYRIKPEGTVRALFQISHGMCEHFLRYTAFAELLAARGFLVFGHDHLGHGNSAQSAEDLGFTAPGGGSEYMINDVHNLSLTMKSEYPGVPLVLFGHSMGSFIARAVLSRFGADYDAAVICGTAGSDSPTGFGKFFASFLMLFFGERHRSSLLKSIAFAGYTKRCGKDCDPNAWLTRDEGVVRAYNDDPFCGYTFTLRAYHDLFCFLGEVSRRDWAQKLPQELPILMIGGEADPVGSYGKGVRDVERRLLDAGHRNLQTILYPGMRHELLGEIGKEQVLEDIFSWLNSLYPSAN